MFSKLEKLGLTLIRLVKVVPHLSADEQVLTLHLSILLLEEVLDGLTNLLLVLVEPGTVKVTKKILVLVIV